MVYMLEKNTLNISKEKRKIGTACFSTFVKKKKKKLSNRPKNGER